MSQQAGDVIEATLTSHRERQDKDGFSKWYVKIDGRRRKIELQEFRGRLYLVGCLFVKHDRVLEFEESLDSIASKFGTVRSK